MTAEDVARRWRSQAPAKHDVYPRATEDVANLECRMNNAHGRSNAPSRTTPQGRRRPSRMCYPKAREQEENPSSWPSLTKCKERALVLGVSKHKLKVAPPRSLATSTLAAYLDLVEAGLSLTPRNGRRVYISWFTGTHRHPTSVLPGTHRRTVPQSGL